ncbi:MAG TPA: hypothetical protein VHM30_02360, partial [Gemmatimonadaceae bacterium]|nr:hypothetical protein [Gemmatimonadaceae bacterium]
MHRSSVLVVVLTSAFIGVAAARGGGGRHEVTPLERHRAAEQSRLRSHFDSVDVELRAREVSALSEAQRARRETLIAWLRDYRDAGRFPENDRLSFAAPFFRDSRGVLCAMGYLIDRSGRGDIVDDVARSRNNAYIRELADDQRLVAWLDSTGLTVAEAARIQPQYGPPPPSEPSGTTKDKVGSGYELASGMFIAGSVVTSAASLLAPSRA